MAVKLDTKKFLGTPETPTEIIPKNSSMQDTNSGFLKQFNETLGVVNSIFNTLGSLGFDKEAIKKKVGGAFGIKKQQSQQIQPYREVLRTPSKTEQKTEVTKQKMDFKKVEAVIDLVIRFKGEDFKVSELKAFLQENENLVKAVLG